MAARRGRHGRVKLDTNVITGLTDFSVSDPHSMVETSVMGDYYATQLKDFKGPWTASFSAKEDAENFSLLFIASHKEAIVPMWFYPNFGTQTDYLYGSGAFSIDSSVTMGDTVNFSGSMDGSGELTWRKSVM